MDGFLVLADAAQNDQASGKISMLGGGWSIVGPGVPPMSVVIFLRASVEEASQPVEFLLRLVDTNREPIKVEGPLGGHLPLEFAGRIHILDDTQPREDWTDVVGLHSSFAVNIPRLSIPSGRAYVWVLETAGKEISSVPFAIRAEPDEDEDADS